jgi:hypothetical protein
LIVLETRIFKGLKETKDERICLENAFFEEYQNVEKKNGHRYSIRCNRAMISERITIMYQKYIQQGSDFELNLNCETFEESKVFLRPAYSKVEDISVYEEVLDCIYRNFFARYVQANHVVIHVE